jgi:hypothetical protein
VNNKFHVWEKRMEHKPPKHILDLFCDEYTAQTQGRQAFIDWYKSIDKNIGDKIYVPEVDGKYSVFVKHAFGPAEVN